MASVATDGETRRSVRVERHLDAPPGAMFEILCDHARYDRFDGIRRSELVRAGSPDPNGLGAVRHVWLGPFRFEEEVTRFDPPHRFDYLIREVRTLPFRHTGGSIELASQDRGTRALWTSTFEVPIPVVGGIVDRIFAARLARGFGGVLDRSAEIASAAPVRPRSGAT